MPPSLYTRTFDLYKRAEKIVKIIPKTAKITNETIASIVDVSFFFFQYIFTDVKDKQRFSIIMEYMSSGAYPEYKIINALCSIYNPDDVMQSFNYSLGEKGTIYKHKKKLKEYICRLKNGEIKFYSKAFFDKETHYYCEETQGYREDNKYFPITTIYRYFETFDEFVRYRNGDLTYCDLSGALECDADFSNSIIDETTKLPVHTNTKVTYAIKKYYQNGKLIDNPTRLQKLEIIGQSTDAGIYANKIMDYEIPKLNEATNPFLQTTGSVLLENEE